MTIFTRNRVNEYIPLSVMRKPKAPVVPAHRVRPPPPPPTAKIVAPPTPPKVIPLRKQLLRVERMEEIIAEECEEHGCSREELMGMNRKRPAVWARHDTIYRIHSEMEVSSVLLGRFFNGRDHSTILHALERGRERHALYLAIVAAVEGRLPRDLN